MSQVLGTLSVELRADTAGFNRDLGKSRMQVMYFERALNTVAKAGRKVYAAGMRYGKKSIDTFAELEHSATMTAAILERTARDSSKSFDTLYRLIRDRSTELSKETIYLPTALANAMHQLAKAGREPEQVIDDIGHAAKVAMATGGDIVHMATEMGRVSTMWPEREMREIATILTEATLRAPQMAGDVAAAIYRAGPLAKELGHSLEEVAAFSAFTSQRGLQGGVSGRALQNILVRMLGFTKANEQQMKDWGITLEDSAGNMRPLYDIFEEIKSYYQAGNIPNMMDDLQKGATELLQEVEGAPKEERELAISAMQEISRFFRLRATPAAVPGIVDPGGLRELHESISRSLAQGEGPHESIARRVMEDTLVGQSNRLISTMEATSASIAETVKPEIELVIDQLQKLVNIVEGASDVEKKFIAYAVAGATMGGLGASQLPTANTIFRLMQQQGDTQGALGSATGSGGSGIGVGSIVSANLISNALTKNTEFLMSGGLVISKIAAGVGVFLLGYKTGEALSEQLVTERRIQDTLAIYSALRQSLGLGRPLDQNIMDAYGPNLAGVPQTMRNMSSLSSLLGDDESGFMRDLSSSMTEEFIKNLRSSPIPVTLEDDSSGNPEKLERISEGIKSSGFGVTIGD